MSASSLQLDGSEWLVSEFGGEMDTMEGCQSEKVREEVQNSVSETMKNGQSGEIEEREAEPRTSISVKLQEVTVQDIVESPMPTSVVNCEHTTSAVTNNDVDNCAASEKPKSAKRKGKSKSAFEATVKRKGKKAKQGSENDSKVSGGNGQVSRTAKTVKANCGNREYDRRRLNAFDRTSFLLTELKRPDWAASTSQCGRTERTAKLSERRQPDEVARFFSMSMFERFDESTQQHLLRFLPHCDVQDGRPTRDAFSNLTFRNAVTSFLEALKRGELAHLKGVSFDSLLRTEKRGYAPVPVHLNDVKSAAIPEVSAAVVPPVVSQIADQSQVVKLKRKKKVPAKIASATDSEAEKAVKKTAVVKRKRTPKAPKTAAQTTTSTVAVTSVRKSCSSVNLIGKLNGLQNTSTSPSRHANQVIIIHPTKVMTPQPSFSDSKIEPLKRVSQSCTQLSDRRPSVMIIQRQGVIGTGITTPVPIVRVSTPTYTDTIASIQLQSDFLTSNEQPTTPMPVADFVEVYATPLGSSPSATEVEIDTVLHSCASDVSAEREPLPLFSANSTLRCDSNTRDAEASCQLQEENQQQF